MAKKMLPELIIPISEYKPTKRKIPEPPYPWYVGEYRNEPWFSDGALAFKGPAPSEHTSSIRMNGLYESFAKADLQRITPERYFQMKDKRYVSFSDRITYINADLYDLTVWRFRKTEFTFQCASTKREDGKPVLIFEETPEDSAMIGIIMPVIMQWAYAPEVIKAALGE